MRKSMQGKRVILVGLGRLGGGVAAAKYFASKGAKLTVTDALGARELSASLKKLGNYRHIRYILGKQSESNFKNQDIAIFNPAIPATSPLVKFAKKHCGRTYNDLSYFLETVYGSEGETGPERYIGVTGTRGKTTITNWIVHFLDRAVMGGNMPTAGLFKLLGRRDIKKKPVVLELSSFQLEFMEKDSTPPHIAVVTNLYVDHLNRHKTFKKYADTKARLFAGQKRDDFLILNADDPNSKIFTDKKPVAHVYFTSAMGKKIENGLRVKNGMIFLAENGKEILIGKIPPGYSLHSLGNLLASMLAAYLWGIEWSVVLKKIPSLPQIPFRQELVYKKRNMKIYNDSASTSPEGAIAAIERFNDPMTVFIFGGTDKMLDFSSLAYRIRKKIGAKRAYFLEGSGTVKLMDELRRMGWKGKTAYPSLEGILREISMGKKEIRRVVFSPGAASFEKFKNEFDRGKRFNRLVKKYFL